MGAALSRRAESGASRRIRGLHYWKELIQADQPASRICRTKNIFRLILAPNTEISRLKWFL
jgi:hypothetical protein